MRIKMFSKGRGWYVSATNYKDDKDKAYLNLFFVNHTEPAYVDNGRGFSVMDIDILEGKFTSYQGKIGLTIFKYTMAEPRAEGEPSHEITIGRSNEGGQIDGIEPDDLPFM